MQTQMAGVVAAALTALVALFFTGFFEGLPEATLGAIVIVAVSGMVKTQRIRELYALRKSDFLLAVTATLAVLSLETLAALAVAVALSIVLLVLRAAKAPLRRLGRLPGGAFGDLERNPEARSHPTALVVRPEAELFFANAESVAEDVYSAATERKPRHAPSSSTSS